MFTEKKQNFKIVVVDGELQMHFLKNDQYKSFNYKIYLGAKVNINDEVYSVLNEDILAVGINRAVKTKESFVVLLYSFSYNTTLWVKNEYPETIDDRANLTQIVIDEDNELVYALGSIKSIYYRGSHVIGYGYPTSMINPPVNTFAIAYGFKAGYQKWINLLGSITYNSIFVRAAYYRGNLFVAIQSYSGKYGGANVIQDITVTVVESETGRKRSTNTFGSPKPTIIMDIAANHMGVYLLANISGELNPHPDAGNVYTFGNASSPPQNGIIWCNTDLEIFSLNILSMNGLKNASILTIQRFIPFISSNTAIDFIYLANYVNGTGLRMMQKSSYESIPFSSSVCNTDCKLCSKQYPSFCMSCQQDPPNAFFRDGVCVNTCGTQGKILRLLNNYQYCRPCHHSCGMCKNFGLLYNRRSCDTCATGFEQILPIIAPFSDYNDESKELTSKICVCATPQVEVNGKCANKCKSNLNHLSLLGVNIGTYSQAYICTNFCPKNTIPFLKYLEENVIAPTDFDVNDYKNKKSTKFTDIDDASVQCPAVKRVAYFSKGSPIFNFILNHKLTATPLALSLSFWAYIDPSNTGVAYMMRCIGLVVSYYDQLSGTVIFYIVSNGAYTVSSGPVVPGQWYHFSFSYSINTVANNITLNCVTLDTATPVNVVTNTVTVPLASPYPTGMPSISKQIVFGTNFPSILTDAFTGYLSEVKIFDKLIPVEAAPILAYKYEMPYSTENPNLIVYFKFNEPVLPTNQYNITDWSQYYKVFVITATDPGDLSKAPSTQSEIASLPIEGTMPELCFFNSIKECKGFYDWSISRLIPDKVFLGLETLTTDYFKFSNNKGGARQLIGSAAWDWSVGDKIALFDNNCFTGKEYGTKLFEEGSEVPGYIDPEKNWGLVQEDSFLELCAYKASYNQWVNVDHIRITPPTIFSPVNSAYYFTPGNTITISMAESRYSNKGDTLILSPECLSLLLLSNYDDYIWSQRMSEDSFIFTYSFDTSVRFSLKSIGKNRLCVIPAYSKNPKRLMVGYSKSTYLVIQNLPLFEEINLLPKSENGLIYAKSSLFRFDFDEAFNMFYNYDYIYYIDCTTKTDDNIGDFECLTTEVGQVDLINSHINSFYVGPGGSVPLVPGATKYCLCYNPVKTYNDPGANPGGEVMIFRSRADKAIKIEVQPASVANTSPNIVAFNPRHPNYALSKDNFIWFTTDTNIFLSSYTQAVLKISISSYLLDSSCFNQYSSLCRVTQYYKSLKSYLFDEKDRLESNDFKFYPGNKSLHFTTYPLTGPGFYLFTISKYGFVNQLTRDYLFTDKMPKDPMLFNFSVIDCEIPPHDIYFSSAITEFTLEGKNLSKSSYVAYGEDLVERRITMYTHEIFAEMYIMNSSLADCNFYLPLLGVKKQDILKVYVDSYNDTAIKFKGLKIPSRCQRGNLYMNLTLRRVIYDVKNQIKLSRYISIEEILIGGFNCNKSCLECSVDSVGCISCHPGYLLDLKKFCVERCPFERQLTTTEFYYSYVNTTNQTRAICKENCDAKYFVDPIEKSCKRCFETCRSCTGELPNQCLSCGTDLYFYKGFCLKSCPTLTAPDTNLQLKRCVEVAGVGKGTLNLTIVDSSYEGMFEEENNFNLSAAVSYDGIFDVHITWTIISQGLSDQDFNSLQLYTFSRNDLRKNTLITGLNIIDIPNYNSMKDNMLVELLGQAGTEYKAQYLKFKMIPRPISIVLSMVQEPVSLDVPFQNRILQSYVIKSEPIKSICYLKTDGVRTIVHFNIQTISDVELNVTNETPYMYQEEPLKMYTLECGLFGSNTSQATTSIEVQYEKSTESHRDLLQKYMLKIWDINGIITEEMFFKYLEIAQALAKLTSGNTNADNLCNSDYECFGKGYCEKAIKDARYCACKGGYKGFNCQFNKDEYKKLQDLSYQAFEFQKTSANNETKYNRYQVMNIIVTTTQLLKFTDFLMINDIKFCVFYLEKLMEGNQVPETLMKTMRPENIQLILEFVDELLNAINFKMKIAINVFEFDVSDESNRVRQSLASNLLLNLQKKVKKWVKQYSQYIAPYFLNKKGTINFETKNLFWSITTRVRSDIEGSILSNEELYYNNTIYIPKNTFGPLDVSIKMFSPVNLQIIEWRNNMFHMDYRNKFKVLTNTKSVYLYNSNQTLIDPAELQSNFEFGLRPLTFRKVHQLLLQFYHIKDEIRCGRWNDEQKFTYTEYYEFYDYSKNLGLTSSEELKLFNFSSAYGFEGDYVKTTNLIKRTVEYI